MAWAPSPSSCDREVLLAILSSPRKGQEDRKTTYTHDPELDKNKHRHTLLRQAPALEMSDMNVSLQLALGHGQPAPVCPNPPQFSACMEFSSHLASKNMDTPSGMALSLQGAPRCQPTANSPSEMKGHSLLGSVCSLPHPTRRPTAALGHWPSRGRATLNAQAHTCTHSLSSPLLAEATVPRLHSPSSPRL